MGRKSKGVIKSGGRYRIQYKVEEKELIIIGYYGVMDNQADYAQAIIYHDCAIKLDDRILDKFSMYTREMEPSPKEIEKYQEWFNGLNAARGAARAERGVYARNHTYEIYYNNQNGAHYVGSFGSVYKEEDKQTAIIYHDCAIFRDKDLPEPKKFNRPRPPNSYELDLFDAWQFIVNTEIASKNASEKTRIAPTPNKAPGSFNGVSISSFDRGKADPMYTARIHLAGQTLHLGKYKTAEQAARVHDLAKRKIYDNNDTPPTNEALKTLKLNFPDKTVADLDEELQQQLSTKEDKQNRQYKNTLDTIKKVTQQAQQAIREFNERRSSYSSESSSSIGIDLANFKWERDSNSERDLDSFGDLDDLEPDSDLGLGLGSKELDKIATSPSSPSISAPHNHTPNGLEMPSPDRSTMLFSPSNTPRILSSPIKKRRSGDEKSSNSDHKRPRSHDPKLTN